MYSASYVIDRRVDRKRKRARKKRMRFAFLLVILVGMMCAALAGLRAVRDRYYAGAALPAPRETGNTPISAAESTGNSDWELILVNKQNAAPSEASFESLQLSNGEVIDARIYPALQKMFDDARAQGVYPLVKSGYRSFETQQNIFTQEVSLYTQQGYSSNEAMELAQNRVALPGHSEHQLGIAVDINADKEISSNDIVFQWLSENSYKYGFILRYPASKTEITGVGYEPWHFRYVGNEAAQEIYSSGLCLEEYLAAKAEG